MHRLLLSVAVLLSLTACHERRGPEPETSKLTEQLFTSSPNDTAHDTVNKTVPMKEKSTTERVITNDEAIVEDIPILEDDLPVLPMPVITEERTSEPTITHTLKQTFTGGKRSDGLDIKTIRSSQNEARTRLVFDTYASATKATQSGNYTFSYNPSKKQIIAVINGYRKFSALLPKKIRTFPSNSIIKNIKMEDYKDDSGFKFSINLNTSAAVNVFELKSPARIVVDITPN